MLYIYTENSSKDGGVVSDFYGLNFYTKYIAIFLFLSIFYWKTFVNRYSEKAYDSSQTKLMCEKTSLWDLWLLQTTSFYFSDYIHFKGKRRKLQRGKAGVEWKFHQLVKNCFRDWKIHQQGASAGFSFTVSSPRQQRNYQKLIGSTKKDLL